MNANAVDSDFRPRFQIDRSPLPGAPFTDEENAIIDRASVAWLDSFDRLTNPDRKGKSDAKLSFTGESADEILARGGVRYDDDPRRWALFETEVRRRAQAVIGL